MIKKPDWLEKGERCWICDEKFDKPYRRGVIQSVGQVKSLCRFQDGHTQQLKNEVLEPRTASSILYQDLMEIDKLNNAELLYHLRVNFESKNIYTYVGNNLLVVNPYKWYPQLYSQELQHFYIEKVATITYEERVLQQKTQLPPHVYAVACQAIRQLHSNNKSQSILISGESGAGKTEANKEVLKLIAKYYGMVSNGIEQRILACNPLLEAFGNAKTIRNDNSSRFGKFIEMQINPSLKCIYQARIINYLLEKSRLISQFEGQRNFHIFYYFLKGIDAQQTQKYGIAAGAKLDDFEYLKGTTFLPGDEKMLSDVKQSLKILPYSDAEECVWRVVAAILHLGNVSFKETPGGKCEVTNLESLKHVCRLLQVNQETFTNSLTTYRIKVSAQSLDKHFSVAEIKDIKDSVSKALYERLFSWLVTALNKGFESSQILPERQKKSLLNIGLLDIYGFEVLKSNSFQQLCINFTNERLHQLYITDMFKSEKVVFQAEGLGEFVQTVQFKDNEPIIDMLDSNNLSVFNLLDEWCSVASPDEQSFLTKIRFHHKKNEYFPATNLNTTSNSLFIRHTPREVQYNVSQFREKNKNQLRDDVYTVMRQSKLWLIQSMFPLEEMNAPTSILSNTNKIKKFLGSKFRSEMNKLTADLQNLSELHFIRCIKSNNSKQPEYFDDRVVVEQIRYLSVLESIQIRRRSYCVRLTYPQFCQRFYWYSYPLSKDKATPKEITIRILKTHFATLTKQDVLFGNTKIFLKDYAEYRMNLAYKKRLVYLKMCAVRIASALIKGKYKNQKKKKTHAKKVISNFIESIRRIRYIIRIKQAVQIIEKFWMKKLEFERNKRHRMYVISLQTYFRRMLEYRLRARKIMAISRIQQFYKKHILRNRMLMYIRVQLSIKDILTNTINTIAEKSVFSLQKYLRTFVCMSKNKQRIRKSIENEMLSLRNVSSRKIGTYLKTAVVFGQVSRLINAILWVQRQYKTKICRRNFLNLKESIVKIQRAYRQFYFRKVESHRIFTQFFQEYNKKLINYNQQVRSVLFGSRKSKQDSQTYVEDILKQHLSKYHTKMTLFYYIVDFESHIEPSDVYPDNSWLNNYMKLYKEGFEKYAPVQQLQIGETMTVAATSNRLYSWGSLNNDDRLTAIQHKGTLTNYRLRKDNLQINCDLTVTRETTNRRVYKLQKHVLSQIIKENVIPVIFPKADGGKIIQVSCGNGHVICRASSRHIYTWGYGVNGQLGHGQLYSEEKPRCIEFFNSTNQLVYPQQVAATFSSSVVLTSNRKIFWFGRNGTIDNVATPREINLQSKGRLIANPELSTPVKLIVSWSKTMSVVGLTILSYNGVLQNNLTLRARLINMIISKWHVSGIDLINPPYTHNIANYLSENSIKLPVSKQQSEMQSRRALRDLQEQIKEVLRDESLEISFSFDNPLFK